LTLLLAGCAMRPPIEPIVACRIVRDNRVMVAEGSARDLVDLSYGTPAHGAAVGAYAQQISAYSMTVIGAAALLGGLVTAFATDPATQPDARNAGFALGGGAIGVAVVGIVLGFTMPRAMRRARERLSRYADRCQ
jgi:hypothetical protein